MNNCISTKKLNETRGKAMVGRATRDELMSVFCYIDHLEMKLDVEDHNDVFGSEGWRRHFGLNDVILSEIEELEPITAPQSSASFLD